MKRVWYLPGRPNKVAIWDQSVYFMVSWEMERALRKNAERALVRRYSLLSSQGLRKLRRNSEKWKNFMYIESHNQNLAGDHFSTFLTLLLSPFC